MHNLCILQTESFRTAAASNGYAITPVYSFDAQVKHAGKRPKHAGWNNTQVGEMPKWEADAQNTGVICNGLRVIDIDIDDPESVEKIVKIAFETLGNAPVRYRENSGRKAILYAAAEGLPEKNVIRGESCQIEILGKGQQFVAHGIHPSGVNYEWLNDRGPQNVHFNELTRVTEQQISAFEKAIRAIIGHPPNIATDAELKQTQNNTAARQEVSIEFVEKILFCIPADLSREEWLKCLMALHDATQGSDEGLSLANRWSETGTKTYESFDDVKKRWLSFKQKENGIGFGTLVRMAEQYSDCVPRIMHEHQLDGIDIDTLFATTEPTMTKPISGIPQGNMPEIRKIDIFPASDFDGKDVKSREWIVPQLIPKSDITILGGDGGTGKSLVALQLAHAVATNTVWLSQPVHDGKCLFLTAEDTKDEVHRRLERICATSGTKFADLEDLHLVSLAGEDALLASPVKGHLLQATALFVSLEREIARLGPSLIVLDTLADLFGGEENQRTQARQFIGLLRGLCINHNVTIVLLAHPSLSGMSNGTGSSGSTGWNNSVRSRLYLERGTADGGHNDNPDVRHLSAKKANYARSDAILDLLWKDGVFVNTAGGMIGDVFSAADRKQKTQNLFLDLVDSYNQQKRHLRPATGHGYAPSTLAKDSKTSGVSKRELVDAMNELFSVGQLRVVEEGPQSRRTKHIVTNRNLLPSLAVQSPLISPSLTLPHTPLIPQSSDRAP